MKNSEMMKNSGCDIPSFFGDGDEPKSGLARDLGECK